MRLFLSLLVCCAVALAPVPARAADSLKVIVVDGDEAANIVAERLAAEPVIEVRDKDDRRVPGAVVRFVIRKTRDRIVASFGNGQAEVRTLTDYSGRAAVNGVTPVEPGSFQIDVEVSYRGQTGKAVIRQTNFPTSADAKAAGREPGKSTNSSTQGSTTSATTSTAATGAATAATAGATGSTAATAAVAAGGGMSKLAVIGLVAGGAAGAGAAVMLSRKEADLPPGTVSGVTPSQTVGVQGGSVFTFSVQATGFDPGSTTYRWEFGDGGTSTEPAPAHTYEVAGTFAVVVTVSDARQSIRSETSVSVYSATGTWRSPNGVVTLQLTQNGRSVTGVATWTTDPGELPYSPCPISGAVQGPPARYILHQPACPHPRYAPLVPLDYDLGLGAQGLSGTVSFTGVSVSRSDPILLQKVD